MSRVIPFATLRQVLAGLGFHLQAVPGTHAIFRHPPTRALVALRFYQDDEVVTPTDLAVAGHVVDEFGILARTDFEAMLHDGVRAG
jgi:hypothetical protein